MIRVCDAPARPERHVLERGACVLDRDQRISLADLGAVHRGDP
jgi:hypothetical protein